MDFELPHATQRRIQERRSSKPASEGRRHSNKDGHDMTGMEASSIHHLEGQSNEEIQGGESNLYDAELEHLMGETLLGRQGRWRTPLCSSEAAKHTAMATVCPCFVVGRVSTLLEHEKPFTGLLSCLGLGYKGLQSCLGSALLALTAPVPIVFPALACWHLSQRRRLMDMYNFKPDPADRCSSLASEDMRALCCLPCALGQEMAFLEGEAAEGGLRFPWESGEAWDLRVLDRDLPQFKVVVMGERGVGKSSLFARLLGKSFKADEVKEDTTVNMGFRVFHTYDKVPAGSIEVSSSARSQRWITKRMCLLRYGLQFWDVPSDEYRAVEAPVFKNTHVAILTFTLLKKHTFDYVREVHELLFQKRAQYSDESFKASMGRRMQKPVPVVLVATKCDLFDEGVCTFYQEVLDFAAHNNLIFLKVSSRTGLGIAKVYKMLMNKLAIKKENLEAPTAHTIIHE